jgi:hypothetical protein
VCSIIELYPSPPILFFFFRCYWSWTHTFHFWGRHSATWPTPPGHCALVILAKRYCFLPRLDWDPPIFYFLLQALERLLLPLLSGILAIPWLPDLTLCLINLLAGEWCPGAEIPCPRPILPFHRHDWNLFWIGRPWEGAVIRAFFNLWNAFFWLVILFNKGLGILLCFLKGLARSTYPRIQILQYPVTPQRPSIALEF